MVRASSVPVTRPVRASRGRSDFSPDCLAEGRRTIWPRHEVPLLPHDRRSFVPLELLVDAELRLARIRRRCYREAGSRRRNSDRK